MKAEGYTAPGFEPVRDLFEKQLAEEEIGAAFAAERDGETLVDLWGGWKDRARSIPWARDTIVPVYSTTKSIAAIVVASLIDRNGFDFDAPLEAIWPEFAEHGKNVTIAEALSHQAGVCGFAEPIDPALWLDPPALCVELAKLAPLWPPGTASGYHAMTWGYIAGEIVRRVTGKTLGTLLRENICAPNAIDFSIGTPDREHGRAAELSPPKQMPDFGELTPIKRAAFLTPWAAPARDSPEWRRVEIPSANGHGAARAVAALYGAYANRGAIAGQQILSDRAFAALTAKRIEGQDLVLPFNLDWRTGVMGNSNAFWGPNRNTFGHAGWGGSCGFGDPDARVSGAYIMNQQAHHLLGDPRSIRLIEALYSCL
ncbi:MAG: serine hydrolase domain-containing protein [Hyphomonadaceae bacterium]